MSAKTDERALYRERWRDWIAMMVGAARTLERTAPHVIAELEAWERENCDGSAVGTGDWPGWIEFIGPCPKTPETSPQQRKRTLPTNLKARVFARDGLVCVSCGAADHLQVDHVVPESAGGSDELSNLQTLCKTCNVRKGSRV